MKDSNLKYIQISRFPLNALKSDFTTYLSLFCCDSTHLTAQPTSNQIYYLNKITSFAITVPAGLDPSLSKYLFSYNFF